MIRRLVVAGVAHRPARRVAVVRSIFLGVACGHTRGLVARATMLLLLTTATAWNLHPVGAQRTATPWMQVEAPQMQAEDPDKLREQLLTKLAEIENVLRVNVVASTDLAAVPPPPPPAPPPPVEVVPAAVQAIDAEKEAIMAAARATAAKVSLWPTDPQPQPRPQPHPHLNLTLRLALTLTRPPPHHSPRHSGSRPRTTHAPSRAPGRRRGRSSGRAEGASRRAAAADAVYAVSAS